MITFQSKNQSKYEKLALLAGCVIGGALVYLSTLPIFEEMCEEASDEDSVNFKSLQ